MSTESYMTVVDRGAAELQIRNSRFSGNLLPSVSGVEAEAGLRQMRAAHPKADHHVYAWRLLSAGTGLLSHRFDDDGEPGGTAGRPVLQVLESRGLVNALVVVVRYFGGVKLGAGGLVRAYSAAATAAVNAATLRPVERRARLEVRVDFPLLAVVEGWAAREGLVVAERGFDPEPWLCLDLAQARLRECEEALRHLTAGKVRLRRRDAVS